MVWAGGWLGLRPARSACRKGGSPRRPVGHSRRMAQRRRARMFAGRKAGATSSQPPASAAVFPAGPNPGPRRCCRCPLNHHDAGAVAWEVARVPAQAVRSSPVNINLGQGMASAAGTPGPCLCVSWMRFCHLCMSMPAVAPYAGGAAARSGCVPARGLGQGWCRASAKRSGLPLRPARWRDARRTLPSVDTSRETKDVSFRRACGTQVRAGWWCGVWPCIEAQPAGAPAIAPFRWFAVIYGAEPVVAARANNRQLKLPAVEKMRVVSPVHILRGRRWPQGPRYPAGQASAFAQLVSGRSVSTAQNIGPSRRAAPGSPLDGSVPGNGR